jgi:hypothetical protein
VKYRLLTVLPVVVALMYGGMQFVAPDRVAMYRVVVLILKGLAAGGAAAAGFRFLRRDYMRAAWLLTACCFGLLFTKDLLFGIGWRHITFPTGVAYVRGGLTLAANIAGAFGAFLLARAWSVAGLIHPGSRGAKVAMYGAGIAIALATAGSATWFDLKDLLNGDPSRITAFASDLGDIAGLVLVAPVLLTAIALRGGLLAWPWTLMAASQLSWLMYDAAGTFHFWNRTRPLERVSVEEVFRATALLYAFSSGIAQRWVMSDMRRSSEQASRRTRATVA